VPPVVAEPRPVAGKRSAAEESEVERQLNQFERTSIRVQKGMFWVTFALLATTVVYSAFSYMQWQEMQAANSRTDTLIQQGVNNMRFTSKTTNDARGDTDRMLKAVEAQAKATTESVGPATTSAATTAAMNVAVAIANARLDQRAWIIEEATTGTPEADKPLTVKVMFRNVGKTPALRVLGHVQFDESSATPEQRPKLSYEGRHPFGVGVVAPTVSDAATMAAMLDGSHIAWESERVARLARHERTLYAHGHLQYADIFATCHWLDFCEYFAPDTGQWTQCGFHNATGEKTCSE